MAPYWKYMTSGPRLRAARKRQLQPQEPVGSQQLYKTTGSDKDKKRLYILFSGQLGMFFVPLAVLLHLLPDKQKDVLVIRSGHEQFYRAGIDGLGVSPLEISQSIQKQYSTAQYKHVSVMGFSAGGFFALRITELLKADAGISFAGIYSRDTLKLSMMQQAGATAFDPICGCRKPTGGRLINVVSSKNEYDSLESFRIQKVCPKLVPFHLINSTTHEVLTRMAKLGYATLFFRLALAKNPIWFLSVAYPALAYGTFVRNIRRLFGVQQIQKWYTEAEN